MVCELGLRSRPPYLSGELPSGAKGSSSGRCSPLGPGAAPCGAAARLSGRPRSWRGGRLLPGGAAPAVGLNPHNVQRASQLQRQTHPAAQRAASRPRFVERDSEWPRGRASPTFVSARALLSPSAGYLLQSLPVHLSAPGLGVWRRWRRETLEVPQPLFSQPPLGPTAAWQGPRLQTPGRWLAPFSGGSYVRAESRAHLGLVTHR